MADYIQEARGMIDRHTAVYKLAYVRHTLLVRKKYGMFGKHNANTRFWHFDFLEMAWHQLETSMSTSMQSPRQAQCYGRKYNCQCPKIQDPK